MTTKSDDSINAIYQQEIDSNPPDKAIVPNMDSSALPSVHLPLALREELATTERNDTAELQSMPTTALASEVTDEGDPIPTPHQSFDDFSKDRDFDGCLELSSHCESQIVSTEQKEFKHNLKRSNSEEHEEVDSRDVDGSLPHVENSTSCIDITRPVKRARSAYFLFADEQRPALQAKVC
jgi:hypothetical protein